METPLDSGLDYLRFMLDCGPEIVLPGGQVSQDNWLKEIGRAVYCRAINDFIANREKQGADVLSWVRGETNSAFSFELVAAIFGCNEEWFRKLTLQLLINIKNNPKENATSINSYKLLRKRRRTKDSSNEEFYLANHSPRQLDVA